MRPHSASQQRGPGTDSWVSAFVWPRERVRPAAGPAGNRQYARARSGLGPREEAAARLHAIADELGANNDVVNERDHIRFVAHVADRVNLKVEFEIEDDGTELEIELTW